VLALVRKAALWIFGFLFEVKNVDKILEMAIVGTARVAPPQRDIDFDRAIDGECPMVNIGGQTFYASEILFSVDYTAYRELGVRLCQSSRNAAVTDDAE
jgi:hypothetical protein